MTERKHVTRLILALVVAAAAAAGCDKGESGKTGPSPAAPEKSAAAQPGGAPAEKTAAPAPAPKADPPAADPPKADPPAADPPKAAPPTADPPKAAPAAADPPPAAPQAGKPAEGTVALAVTAGGTARPAAKKEVDNSRCHVCHVNFSDEKLAVSHAKNGVGCERCHGPSDNHADDEANSTPPSIMYPREKIDAACHVCHPDPMERIVPDAKYCLQVLLTAEEKKKVCTDCHGEHKMAQRQVRWNKVTGEVLPKEPEPPKPAVKS
jgi:hypothetical protein